MSLVEGPVSGSLVANEEAEVGGDVPEEFHAVAQSVTLKANGAETEPLVVDDFFEQDLFHVRGRLEFAKQIDLETVELLGVFAFDEVGGGGEAVGDRVQAGFGFAFGSLGSGGLLRIVAVGRDLFGGCHKFVKPF